MKKEICKNCKYFKVSMISDSIHYPEEAHTGDCKRFPPLLFRNSVRNNIYRFPSVGTDNWCGEYKSKTVSKKEGDITVEPGFSQDYQTQPQDDPRNLNVPPFPKEWI